MSPRQALNRKRNVDALLSPDLFKALGDETRVKLFACLIKCSRPCNVSEVAACCDVDFSVVSRHLQLLERAGVLTSSKTGRVVTYSVKYTQLTELFRKIAEAIDSCKPACARASCGEAACDGTACCSTNGGCCG